MKLHDIMIYNMSLKPLVGIRFVKKHFPKTKGSLWRLMVLQQPEQEHRHICILTAQKGGYARSISNNHILYGGSLDDNGWVIHICINKCHVPWFSARRNNYVFRFPTFPTFQLSASEAQTV